MKFCLPPKIANEFLRAVKSGELDVVKLADMESAARRDFLSKYVGEAAAKEVNALFESKLLLKNQEAGLINWIKSVGGLKPKEVNDLVSRVRKMDKVLNPAEQEAFLADLAAKKLGTDVTFEEAQKITELSDDITKVEQKMDPETATFPTEADRLDYGRSKVALEDFVNDLKTKSEKLTLKDFKKDPFGSTKKSFVDFAGLTKSLKASFDNSVIGRQGLKVLFTHPKIWLKNAKQSFVDMYRTYGGKNVMDEIRADVLSRPNAIKGLYKAEKLAVGVTEEAFPTNLPERIPGIGRAFKASESAFTGFQYRTRADIFDKFMQIAEQTGADTTGIGKVANSLTGRGNLGFAEPIANTVNNVFFSPRFLKSNFDLLTAHLLDKNIGSFARKQAAINLEKVVGGIATILTIAKAIDPKSVDFDPRSADFGKIRVGNTRFDVSGGMGSLVTLASRVITQESKSSTTGKITKLNTGLFGAPTVADLLASFAGNKLSPVGGIVRDTLLKGEDFEGNKPTVGGELKNLLAPLPYTNIQELLADPKADSATIVAAIIADALGISTNTYVPKKKKKKK